MDASDIGDVPVGRSAGLSSARVRGRHLDAPRVPVVGHDPQGHQARERPDSADDRVGGVVGQGPQVVARRGELVAAHSQVVETERVTDDRVDVGVLDEQRAAAGAVQGMPEGPQPVAVGVRDRPDRREPDVAAGQPGRHRRAGPQGLRREGGGGRRRSDDQGAVGSLARHREGAGHRAADAAHGERSGQRASRSQQRSGRGARPPAGRASRRGSPRSAVARTVVLAVVAQPVGDRADDARHAVVVRAVDAASRRSRPRRPCPRPPGRRRARGSARPAGRCRRPRRRAPRRRRTRCRFPARRCSRCSASRAGPARAP